MAGLLEDMDEILENNKNFLEAQLLKINHYEQEYNKIKKYTLELIKEIEEQGLEVKNYTIKPNKPIKDF